MTDGATRRRPDGRPRPAGRPWRAAAVGRVHRHEPPVGRRRGAAAALPRPRRVRPLRRRDRAREHRLRDQRRRPHADRLARARDLPTTTPRAGHAVAPAGAAHRADRRAVVGAIGVRGGRGLRLRADRRHGRRRLRRVPRQRAVGHAAAAQRRAAQRPDRDQRGARQAVLVAAFAVFALAAAGLVAFFAAQVFVGVVLLPRRSCCSSAATSRAALERRQMRTLFGIALPIAIANVLGMMYLRILVILMSLLSAARPRSATTSPRRASSSSWPGSRSCSSPSSCPCRPSPRSTTPSACATSRRG